MKYLVLPFSLICLSLTVVSAFAGVSFYSDDGKCEPGNFLGSVGPRTNCDALPFTRRVWGIKLDGSCLDISDLDPAPACRKFKDAAEGVLFYRDDGKCELGNFLGAASPTTACDELPFRDRVWGISINGRCMDVSDVEPGRACEIYKNRRFGVSFFRDDGKCEEGNFLGSVGPFTDCDSLPFRDRVWGVMQSGVCSDISDLDPKQACLMYQNSLRGDH